ncbi:SGNH/GDSL hydrolase family protein [Bacillus solimangrovi]|uniref:SGNH hydrolase-type esterase domain-containing protein n=1 Tax=Bacillus solimangrovi TaxID=1305675 RepID=A0A1E5LFB7_9BACI|nr:SGNH/GDSL hydrolase family protein [Bacillus solimangrovi]OEH92760.1 hypothetical protein BFG57_01805 [Bacillus solimangrovi]
MKQIMFTLTVIGIFIISITFTIKVFIQPVPPLHVQDAMSKPLIGSTYFSIMKDFDARTNIYEKNSSSSFSSEVMKTSINFLVKDDVNITAIGDSLTQGVGDETKNGGYVGILENMLSNNKQGIVMNIDNFGKRGNRTDQLLKRLEQKELVNSLKKADIVLITIGANDVMKVVKSNFTELQYHNFIKAQSGYEKRLRDIFNKVNEINSNASIYLLGIYNPFEEYFSNIPEIDTIMNDWNILSSNITDEYENVTFIPIGDIFSKSRENLLAEDQFHPNLNGYAFIAKRVFTIIEEDISKNEIQNH